MVANPKWQRSHRARFLGDSSLDSMVSGGFQGIQGVSEIFRWSKIIIFRVQNQGPLGVQVLVRGITGHLRASKKVLEVGDKCFKVFRRVKGVSF